MDNESQNKIYDLIETSHLSINKDDENDGDPESERSSLMAKKKEIMKNLNELVQNFNENNQKIKDALLKGPLPFDMIKEIQATNDKIQAKSEKIGEIVQSGKEKAQKIDENLDVILEVNIPKIVAKYVEKNDLMDKCDE